jgi:hypothetical protein
MIIDKPGHVEPDWQSGVMLEVHVEIIIGPYVTRVGFVERQLISVP